jgi:uncharacterized protein (TIGR02646 family)
LIRLHRPALEAAESQYLARQAAKVAAKPQHERAAEADRLWKQKSSVRFERIRAVLSSMCSSYVRCMYCEDSRATAIDHFEPKAKAPLRAFEWTNYLGACEYCNSNEKRDAFPIDANGAALLVDPTSQEPTDHLRFSPSSGRYEPPQGSPKGDATIATFGLNGRSLPDARRDAWVLLECSIVAYAEARSQGNAAKASFIRAAATRHPFAAVLDALLTAAAAPVAGVPSASCRAALARFPEIAAWRRTWRP